jgi:protein TonB
VKFLVFFYTIKIKIIRKYISTKLKVMLSNSWYNLVSDVRNEIVFHNRNKNYGAYQLRKEYNKTISSILLSMILSALCAFGAYKLIEKFVPEDDVIEKFKYESTQVIITPPQELKNELPIPTQPSLPSNIKTIQHLAPVIKNEMTDEEKVPSQEELNNSNIGTQTQQGSEDDGVIQVPDENQGNSVIESKAPEIFTVVQIMPEFPGGKTEMTKFIQKNLVIPQIAIESGISGKCFVGFIVNEDGKISNIEILKGVPGCPECDKEVIRVIKLMPTWEPGKQNGRAVKVYITLPINFVVK